MTSMHSAMMRIAQSATTATLIRPDSSIVQRSTRAPLFSASAFAPAFVAK